jgi:Flp pilus assembly pilin Flp
MRAVSRHDSSKGESLIEYALIIALVSLAAIVALGFLSGKINELFIAKKSALELVFESAHAEATSSAEGIFPRPKALERSLAASALDVVTAVGENCQTAQHSQLSNLVVIDSESGPTRLVLYGRTGTDVVMELEGTIAGKAIIRRSLCSPLPIKPSVFTRGWRWINTSDGTALVAWLAIFGALVAALGWIIRRLHRRRTTSTIADSAEEANGTVQTDEPGPAPQLRPPTAAEVDATGPSAKRPTGL